MKPLLVLAADNLTPIQPRIDRYRASVEAFGTPTQQTVLPRGASVAQVADLARANGTGPVQIFGHVPVPMCLDGLDGHGYRPGSKDLLYAVSAKDVTAVHTDGSYDILWGVPQTRAVGRADFSGLPFGEEIALTAAWLDANDAYRRGALVYEHKSILNCELDYLDPGLSARLVAIMEAVTGAGSVLDTRNAFPFQKFFQTYAGRSFLLGAMYDGGHPFEVGEYNTGFAPDFASGLCRIAVMLMFCSNGWHPDDWYLQRAALVGGAQAVTYGTWDAPHLDTWSETVPIGVAAQNRGANAYTICGDVMLLRPAPAAQEDDLSQAQMDAINAKFADMTAKYTALAARVDKMAQDKDVVVTDTNPPPPATIRRNCGGPALAPDWLADGNFSGGQTFNTPRPVTVAGVTGAAAATVYATGRTGPGPFTYIETLAPGPYVLRLHFEESANDSAGRRLQDITVQGKLALSAWDIFAAAGGRDRACVRDLAVTVGADGRFVLAVAASANSPDTWPWLCGYELVKQ